ncbi:MAG: hypothetical protein AAFO84_00055 [Cyanobacteria bacterium J06598_1]
MHQLSPFTCRRLSQLPRLTSVWECDRRPLPPAGTAVDDSGEVVEGDCILWVDGLQGVVRGLNVVPKGTGHEAIVRTLLQAIETPQGRVEPARPRKVVVRDREIQFFLRGALQALDIPVEYAHELPIIDEVFEKLQTPEPPETRLPDDFEDLLLAKSAMMWEDAPWKYLSEQEILAIELNCWEIETLYLSVLGLAGMEYGLLFYRNLDSLKQFRQKLMHSDDFSDGMQQAFLEQNCLFINFNPAEGVIPFPMFKDAEAQHKAVGGPDSIGYEFGSLHPLEGLRSQLAEEEAASLIVTLEALHRFFKKNDISQKDFALSPVTSRFRIPSPLPNTALGSKTTTEESISVKVLTLPDISRAFLAESFENGSFENGSFGTEASEEKSVAPAAIIDDSVPEGSLIMLGSHKEKDIEPLRSHRRVHYQSFLTPPTNASSPTSGPTGKKNARNGKTKWPVLTIQTTRPKAKQLVERLKQEGGIQAICFNPGSDPISGQVFQIGLIQTTSGQLHLFNEYEISDPTDSQAMEKWSVNSASNDSCCGCIIAAGSTGAKRGRPTVREVVAFFEAYTKQPEEIGLTPLVMSYVPDWQ